MEPEQAPAPEQFDWRHPLSFFPVAMAATISPRQFFATMPDGRDMAAPLSFFLLAQLVPSLVAAAMTIPQGISAALLMLASTMLSPVLYMISFSVLLYGATQFLFRSSSFTLRQIISVVCYSSGIRIIAFAPWLLSSWAGLLVSLLMFVLILRSLGVGIKVVGQLRTMQMLGALSLSFMILAAASLWMGYPKLMPMGGVPATPPTVTAPAPQGN